MKRRIVAGLLAFALALSLSIVSLASGGSTSDPVVSKSYVDTTFFNSVINSAASKSDNKTSSFKTEYLNKLNSVVGAISNGELEAAVADEVLNTLQAKGKYLFSTSYMSPKNFTSGDVIKGLAGTTVMIRNGTAKCSSGSVINITQGKEIVGGTALGRYTAFMFTESDGSVEITSKKAEVLIDGTYSCVGYEPKYTDEAYALKQLGLVRGAADGMELYRGNTRAESITMLVRLLGEETPALAAAHKHPFTDVDAWAQRYVGYAYRMGYTKGVTNTRYDGNSLTTATQYMTFVLRSLGYSEEAGDFKYLTALSDAVALGVIPQSVANELSKKEFKRDDVMHISYLAMSAKVKGSERTLLSKLVANGAVDAAAANEFLDR